MVTTLHISSITNIIKEPIIKYPMNLSRAEEKRNEKKHKK